MIEPMTFNPSRIEFPEKVLVTEQEIDTSVLTDSQRVAYLDLFRRVIQVYESKGKPRVIVGLSGPTGSGKSVIAALFKEMARQLSLQFRFETLGIDAFHYSNAYLLTHTDGDKMLKDLKGRFDTYDVPKLLKTVESFLSGQNVVLPAYSRKTHDPIENAAVITEENALLLIEGLWLLYDKNGWEQIGNHLDFSIFISVDKDTVREAVIKRHTEGGRSREHASAYYNSVDSKNFDLVMTTKNRANEVIPSYFYS
jgi:putative kinase